MMTKFGIFALIVLALLGGQTVIFAEGDMILVVVNKENAARVLTREELRPLFQTTKTEWPDGTKAVPVNLPEDSPLRQKFDLAILGLDPDRVERYWIDRKIRGGERPPRKVPTTGAVLSIVASNKGAIGYVADTDLNDTVRTVAKISNGRVLSP